MKVTNNILGIVVTLIIIGIGIYFYSRIRTNYTEESCYPEASTFCAEKTVQFLGASSGFCTCTTRNSHKTILWEGRDEDSHIEGRVASNRGGNNQGGVGQ